MEYRFFPYADRHVKTAMDTIFRYFVGVEEKQLWAKEDGRK